MKRILWALCLTLAILCFSCTVAYAADNPIKASIQIEPASLSKPGEVSVTISLSNTTSEAIAGPITLYDPDNNLVSDFGDGGSVKLDAGATYTTAEPLKWAVTQQQLNDGKIIYHIKYETYDATSKQNTVRTQFLRADVQFTGELVGLNVVRSISPANYIAVKDQEVVITYTLVNTGTTGLKDIVVKENSSISSKSQTIQTLAGGASENITFTIKMGTKTLTSNPTITYKASGSNAKKNYEGKIEKQTIEAGKVNFSTSLKPSANGVNMNETVDLVLKCVNKGNIDYTGLTVTDPNYGDLFLNFDSPAGETVELTKTITVLEDMSFAPVLKGVNASGIAINNDYEAFTVYAVDPAKALNLEFSATAESPELFSLPYDMKFTFKISNPSPSDAKELIITSVGSDAEVAEVEALPAGQTIEIERALSVQQAGRYQFMLSAKDAVGDTKQFTGDVMTFTMGTVTNAPTATPAITVVPPRLQTMPANIEMPAALVTTGSALQVALVIGIVLLVISGGLLAAALVIRFLAKKKSESAMDHLERAQKRNYIAEPEEAEEQPDKEAEKKETAVIEDDEIFSGAAEIPEDADMNELLKRIKEKTQTTPLASDKTPTDSETAAAETAAPEKAEESEAADAKPVVKKRSSERKPSFSRTEKTEAKSEDKADTESDASRRRRRSADEKNTSIDG
ncbi:MAG: hypothetical protein PHI27_04755 [Eubacteriales bacterium]|nr:hypothetical protein [Eubacteriales bacterium]MDD3881544.1 hypothetical protein [Eubacteriales bacterium]MDD4513386.1 hypothetical protein [Eubacteriales bacterium]